jgi:hypothetical protein
MFRGQRHEHSLRTEISKGHGHFLLFQVKRPQRPRLFGIPPRRTIGIGIDGFLVFDPDFDPDFDFEQFRPTLKFLDVKLGGQGPWLNRKAGI